MDNKRNKMKYTFLFMLFSVLSVGYSQDSNRLKHFNIDGGLAIQGYDPVSYFDGKAREGKKKYSFEHQGITYRFLSAANMAKFQKDPSHFEPAYGGWCAYAMGVAGEKAKIDPETFKILNNRLYLFYNFWGNNTLNGWNKDENSLESKANQQWEKRIAN